MQTTSDIDTEATAISQAVTAVQWMAEALDAPDRATRIERLTELTNRADYVTRAAHQRLAELQSMAELAADEQHRRVSSPDTTAIIDGARLDVGLPGGTSATITVAVAADGRVTWQAPDVDLPQIRTVSFLWQAERHRRGETDQHPSYTDNPFRPR